jgi:D-alanyl-D-alanine carboxypeptidase
MKLGRAAAAAVLAFFMVGVAAAPARVEAKPPLKRAAERLVRNGAPGAIVVVRDGAGVHGYAAGYASIRGKVRMTPFARFRIASLTKTFVATVVLQLAGERRLGLDDSVERWMPGLVPAGSGVTLRQLLNHTSGIYNYTDDPEFLRTAQQHPRRVWAPRQLVAIATAHPPLFAPGTSWSYSNTNYILLGLVIEAVTGRSVGNELSERIFTPLGLRATSLPTTRAMPAPFARGYLAPGNGIVTSRAFRLDVTTYFDPSWAWTAGAIVSNGVDLTRFYAALLGGELLSPALLAEMMTTVQRSDYGLGLARAELRCGTVWGHGGNIPGYRTLVLGRAGGGRVAVVMVNVDESGLSDMEHARAAEEAACTAS